MDSEKLNREKYRKFFSDERFWGKLRTAAAKAGASVVYAALVLYYVLKSSDVPLKMKLYIMGALGYLILPTDLLPDFIPFVGYADDMAALVAVYKLVKDSVTDDIKAQAKAKAQSWFGIVEITGAEDKIDRDVEEQ